MRIPGLICGLLLSSTAIIGCGDPPDCENTCNILYQSEECNISSPGSTTTDLLDLCNESCEAALATPGEVGDYNPNEREASPSTVELKNDKQAALWMKCVSETACDLLEDGYCAPVW